MEDAPRGASADRKYHLIKEEDSLLAVTWILVLTRHTLQFTAALIREIEKHRRTAKKAKYQKCADALIVSSSDSMRLNPRLMVSRL